MARVPLTARQIAKRLNDHHNRTCAGFYGSKIGGRFFQARTQAGKLQVTPDFGERWITVEGEDVAFHDHNGRPIYL